MPRYRVGLTRTIKQVVYLDIEAPDNGTAHKTCLKAARSGEYNEVGSKHEGTWKVLGVKEMP